MSPIVGRRRGGAALLTVLILVSGCSRREKEPTKEAPDPKTSGVVTLSAAQIQHGGVRWASVAQTEMTPTVELPAQLVPNEDRTVRLSASAQARIAEVRVRVGDRVARGQTLVVLHSPQAAAAATDVTKASAEVEARRAAYVYAKTARERSERLLAAKAAAIQDLQRSHADEELAKSALEQAQAELARARAAVTQMGVGSAGTIILRSPISGIVLARDAVVGAVTELGANLMTVTDPTSLWLEVSVSDRIGSALRPGQTLQFSVPAYPGELFGGRLQAVGAALDSQTRTLPVRAAVPNVAGKLRPAMFATVLLGTGESIRAIDVPDSAVVLVDEKPVVFVSRPLADGGATFELRRVEIGIKRGGRTLVSSGVAPGETIVTDGVFAIKSQLERSKLAVEG